MQLLNFELLKNPMNWIIIATMLLVFVVGVDLVRRYLSQSSAEGTS